MGTPEKKRSKEKYFDEKEVLSNYLYKHGLKYTKQREEILITFLETEGHVSAEELYNRITRKMAGIGLSTIYRSMKLFCDCGLAQERMFGDGQARFEHSYDHTHHDHLVCSSCGEIKEFENDEIEKLQAAVAKDYQFLVYSHKLELYGLCMKCRDSYKAR